MKKLMCWLLVCLVMPLSLQAAMEGNDFAIDGEGVITAYTGSAETVDIPASVGGVRVKAVGTNAFGQNAAIREVVLPEGLTHIMASAFYFCENLSSVSLPESLQAIDSYAFFSCSSLGALVFPASLTFIDDHAFSFAAKLADVQFRGPVPFVSKTAFEGGPSERRFTVPEARMAGYEALLGTGCVAGKEGKPLALDDSFGFDASTGQILSCESGNALVRFPMEIGGAAVTGIADNALMGQKWIRLAELPEGVTEIGRQAFFATQLARAILPAGLTDIGEGAFGGAPLEELALPESITRLGKAAFSGSQLAELRLPAALASIPESAFERSWQLETVYFPGQLKEIGPKAFLDCDRMGYLVFAGETPPAIARDAFLECEAIADIDTAYTASSAQAKLFEEAFLQAGLPAGSFRVWRANHPDAAPYPHGAAFTFDEATGLVTAYQGSLSAMNMFFNFHKADGTTMDITGLGEGLFEGSNLEAFYAPRNDVFATIGERAFKGSKLSFIDLFDTVTDIGAQAFADCAELTEITLPASVRAIGAEAFSGCANLRSVTFLGESLTIGEDAFAGCAGLSELVLPAGAQAMGPLGLDEGQLRISQSATEEQRLALQAALALPWYFSLPREGEPSAWVKMPEGLEPTPESEFEFDPQTGHITKYTGTAPRVVVPREIGGVVVRGIAYPGFSNLSLATVAEGSQDNLSLREVVLPESVTYISDSAFLNCAALEKFESYGPTELIGIRAFENCKALREAHFYNGVREMGVYAFNFCESLHQITLGNKLKELPEGAFAGCGFTGSLVLDVPAIGQLAYKDNAGISEIHILPAVTHLGEGVFQGMTGLKEVYFEAADASILGEYRFQFDQGAAGLSVCLPADAGDEAVALFVTKLNQNLLPGESIVMKKDCPLRHESAAPAQQPETAALAADATDAADAAEPLPDTASPAPETDTTPGTVAAEAPAEENDGGLPARVLTLRCTKATSGGIEIPLETIGEYAIVLKEGGKADLTIGGVGMPDIPYTQNSGAIVLDYYGQAMELLKVEGGYELNFMGAMMLFFQAE